MKSCLSHRCLVLLAAAWLAAVSGTALARPGSNNASPMLMNAGDIIVKMIINGPPPPPPPPPKP